MSKEAAKCKLTKEGVLGHRLLTMDTPANVARAPSKTSYGSWINWPPVFRMSEVMGCCGLSGFRGVNESKAGTGVFVSYLYHQNCRDGVLFTEVKGGNTNATSRIFEVIRDFDLGEIHTLPGYTNTVHDSTIVNHLFVVKRSRLEKLTLLWLSELERAKYT